MFRAIPLQTIHPEDVAHKKRDMAQTNAPPLTHTCTQVRGLPTINIPKGKLHVDIKVMGVKIFSEVQELCDVVQCPLTKGKAFEGKLTQEIPAETPNKAGATIRISLVEEDGTTVSCLESYVQVSKDVVLEAAENEENVKPDFNFLLEHWRKQFPKAILNSAEIFMDNALRVLEHNAKKERTFEMALNEYAGMTADEFAATRMGVREPKQDVQRNGPLSPRVTMLRPNPGNADPPAELDWSSKGVVSAVKNQGSCGSCWAFSAIGSLESAYAIKTGNLVEFSEQELVSCDDTDFGCQGGLMDSAFDWIERSSSGLCREADYPYTSGTTSARGECMQTTCNAVEGSVPKGYVDIPPNEAALLAGVSQHGPVSVAIEADQSVFQFYHKGVLTGACGTRLDHGVLLVGFGVDASTGMPFWKVKNSWGAGWGEEGYVRIQRGKRWPKGGECGIASKASYPVL